MSAISANYPSPVTVNGFSCRNCTEVDYAKRNIDPAHPRAGPFGMNDPEEAKASQGLVERRKTEIMEELKNPVAYGRAGAPARSSATGGIIDRFG